MNSQKVEDKSLYERYGFRGLMTDYIYRMYFEYKFSSQTDDIALILFERFYLTPWIRKYPTNKPRYSLKECQSKLSKNLIKLSGNLNTKDYKVKDELYELMDVFRDMESNFTPFFKTTNNLSQ